MLAFSRNLDLQENWKILSVIYLHFLTFNLYLIPFGLEKGSSFIETSKFDYNMAALCFAFDLNATHWGFLKIYLEFFLSRMLSV